MPRIQRKAPKEAKTPRSIVRESIALALYHTLLLLVPIMVERVPKLQRQHRPHPFAVEVISLWWTCRVTGTVPHLVIRMAEHQLGRPNTPPFLLLIALHVLGQFIAMGMSARELTEAVVSWKLFAQQLPLDCVRISFMAVAIQVVPVLLRVNRVELPGWLLLFLLFIPTLHEDGMASNYQPITYYFVINVLSGLLTGRWMQWCFPDDPGSRAAMLS